MDRRQKKTREAIYLAVAKLLTKKHFNSITVQEIIDVANIGRSTFYAHFETKEMLLKEMCNDIFEHIFNLHPISEDTHDFSLEGRNMQVVLTHILYHVREDKNGCIRVLCTDSGELFMGFFKVLLKDIFKKFIDYFPGDIPDDFLINYFTESFGGTVVWWIRNDMTESPEKVVKYYLELLAVESVY
ncbi:DNA-binding transcriptional regulator, AcrR family [Acetitomaculum ruminis DSM 5522]|uniref:DNA-binding transcriptional regulator, AcrR family n=1 Tax=Acetitomaculum ruminis DSM 5522 TaxID=1120918 RepID=A0A1I0W2J4_9FIRM|nr:TetR/AcrR family transcriptional regulator [Acetitomaculum ruminis]SFA82862.1 DNA-binding transcriptional regulator, AcrR family [Acetitomaculum ruminis DSM 5522]